MGADSRAAIFAAIRANRPAVEAPLPSVPLFDEGMPADLLPEFCKRLELMGGRVLEAEAGDPLRALAAAIDGKGVIATCVPELVADPARQIRAITPDMTPTSCADVEIAVVRASFGVAETGSVCLVDSNLIVNTVAYLAQHLIVLLDPRHIVPNLHHAYRQPQWREHHYAVFHSGPSATADIEGVLVRGAQGVRSLRVLLCGEPDA